MVGINSDHLCFKKHRIITSSEAKKGKAPFSSPGGIPQRGGVVQQSFLTPHLPINSQHKIIVLTLSTEIATPTTATCITSKKMEIATHINNIAVRRNFVEHLPYNKNLKPLLSEKEKLELYAKFRFGNRFTKESFMGLILTDSVLSEITLLIFT